jgi:hypothetical protein
MDPCHTGGKITFLLAGKNAIDIPRRDEANSLRYKIIFFTPAGGDFVFRIGAESDYGIGMVKRAAVWKRRPW